MYVYTTINELVNKLFDFFLVMGQDGFGQMLIGLTIIPKSPASCSFKICSVKELSFDKEWLIYEFTLYTVVSMGW